MKTFKQIITTAVVGYSLINLTSCNFLDKSPDDQLTLEMEFSDKIRTEDWLASVYAGIPSPMWSYMTNQGYNIMSDDMVIPIEWSPYGWNKAKKIQINFFSLLLKKVKNHYIILNKIIILYHSQFVNIWDSSYDLIAPKTFHIIKKMI